MMFCRQLNHSIIQLATAAFFLLGGSGAFAVDGPSFDCSRGVRQTLAAILCTNQEAAQADWDVNSAYWALFADDREETTFNETVRQRCALPPLMTGGERAGRVVIQDLSRRTPGSPLRIPTSQPVTEKHVRCVVSAFQSRAQALRGRLTGEALAESNLTPEQHMEIQAALAQRDFCKTVFEIMAQTRMGNSGQTHAPL